jgi:hypothetical protein
MNPSIAFPLASAAPVFTAALDFKSYDAHIDHPAIDSPLHTTQSQPGLPAHRAAKLAREVFNPLTCINLSIDMINSAATAAECKVYLKIISKSSKRIEQMVKEILQ